MMNAQQLTSLDQQMVSVRNTMNANVYFSPGMTLAEVEKAVIIETLKKKNFNRTHAARTLGIGIRTLQRKLKQYCCDH